jgi:NAD+ dependent glucose-6-phosphate dehydrogenase
MSQVPAEPRLVITGSSGAIGTILVRGLCEEYRIVGLDPRSPQLHHANFTWQRGSVSNAELLQRVLPGSRAVIHLATGAPDGWTGLRDTDIVGTKLLFDTASSSGVQRVIFASTNHVVGRFELDRLADVASTEPARPLLTGPVRPDSAYGAAKAFGEAYARFAAETLPLSVSCLRIGTVRLHDDPERFVASPEFSYIPGGEEGARQRLRATWLRHPDLLAIMREELHAPDKFRLRFAVSDNPGRFWPLEVYRWNPALPPEGLTGTRHVQPPPV